MEGLLSVMVFKVSEGGDDDDVEDTELEPQTHKIKGTTTIMTMNKGREGRDKEKKRKKTLNINT